MICFNCGYKMHAEDIHLCPLCGMKFSIKCSTCNAFNPPMARYCFNCGQGLGKPDDQNSIQNFDILRENRRNVAVIFADVSGFTALSERLDPEEVREIINECFEYITKPVYELEGSIDKYIGDCVMILFGAKYVHHDDPKRAVICAMRMRELVEEFSKKRLSARGISLDLSIGINYGLVVTGWVGNTVDRDYTVMGDVVNTAQRLEVSAEKGTILVSDAVYQETMDQIYYGDEREIIVKNKEKPVKCYSPMYIKDVVVSKEMVLIQREQELEILHLLYNNRHKEGCCTIIGEAGTGKTSLAKKFVESIHGTEKRIWIECNANYQNRVYHIVGQILLEIMNINIYDSQDVKKERLDLFLEYIFSNKDRESVRRCSDFLGLILGLKRDYEFQNILNAMNYQDIEREISKQLVLFFDNLEVKQSGIIVVDDLQWADKSSIYLIKDLLSEKKGRESFFVLTSRFEVDAFKEASKSFAYELELGNLSMAGINSLASRILGCSKIEDSMLIAISNLTDGNPLYVVELTTTIKRKGFYRIEEDIAYMDPIHTSMLPQTLENLILANLSTLDEEIRNLLQVASVIGKEFRLSLLTDLLKSDIRKSNILDLAIQQNIISLKSIDAHGSIVDRIYIFQQDTVREAIYQSILNKDKKKHHKNIADILEQIHAKELENYYEILYLHYQKADIEKKACQYALRAGLKYKNDFRFEDALGYYEKFLVRMGFQDDSLFRENVIKAMKDVGYIHTVFMNFDKSLEYLDRALKIAKLSDDIFSINIMKATIYKEKGFFKEALDILEEIEHKIRPKDSIYGKLLQLKCSILRATGNPEALKLAERSEEILLKVRDYDNLAETMSQAGIIYFIQGEIEQSLYYLNKGYSYAEKISNLRLMARISGNLGIVYHASGNISKAYQNLYNSIDLSKKISNLQSYISGCINLSIVYLEMGLFSKAEKLLEESLNNARKFSQIYNECISLTNLGDIMYEKGQYTEAFDCYGKSCEIAKAQGMPVEEGINYLGFVKLYLRNNTLSEVMPVLEKAHQIFREADEVSYIGDYYRYMSIYELHHKRMEQALSYCKESNRIADESKNDMKKLKGLRLKGIILWKTEKNEDALEQINQSIVLAEQLESNYEAAKGYYYQYIINKNMGQSKEAKICLMEAKNAIEKVDECRWKAIIDDVFSNDQNEI
ncbi:MAG: tetratricopeptide repeat protein [Bacillota bacterium]